MNPDAEPTAETPPAVTAPNHGEAQSGIPPMLAKSVAAFHRDLPELLQTHPGKWVAYHGDERLGFGTTQRELYQKGLGRGLSEWEFTVEHISPPLEEEDYEWFGDREFDDEELFEDQPPCP